MYASKKDSPLSKLLFDDVEKINHDQDYWFQLRGDNSNPLIDAATPLFGFSLRVRSLTACDNIDQIYTQTVEEIKAIEVELTEQGYDHAIMVAYRYVLCASLDEAVMGTDWGASSIWAEHSMLTRFHNETWGGEKVFSILSRLEGEPERYRQLLGFIYQCLILGFEGKYRVMEGGTIEREKIISRLYDILSSFDDGDNGQLTSPNKKVVKSHYKVGRKTSLWTVFFGFAFLWLALFLGYTHVLQTKTQDVLTQLNQLL